jgi:hypothetical protein
MALEVQRQLAGMYPLTQKPQQFTLNAYDATYNLNGNILNGALTGTGGSVSTGCTGTLPDNFQVVRQSGTSTCVASIVSRPDGLAGNAIRLVFTANGTGATSDEIRFNYWSGSAVTLAGFAAEGDLLSMEYELAVTQGHAGVFRFASPRLSNSASLTSGAVTTTSFDGATNTINNSAGAFSTLLGGRWVKVSTASGGANHLKAFRVLSATPNQLTIDRSTAVTTETAVAAGSTTVTQLVNSSIIGSTAALMPDVTLPTLSFKLPLYQPWAGNLAPRISFYIDGTKTGSATVHIMNPRLFKMPFAPSVLNILADDDN